MRRAGMMERPSIDVTPRRSLCIRVVLLALILVSVCGGCADYKWITDDFPQAEKLALENNKYLFIYYRWWMSPECGAVERDVLEHPTINKLFRLSVNCWLHQDWEPNNQIMANRYRIQTVPAFVIVSPDGDFRKLTSIPSVDQFQRFVRSAIPEAAAPTTGPARKSRPALRGRP